MKKLLIYFVTLTGLAFLFASSTEASLITIDTKGDIVWSVLSEEVSLSLNEPNHSYIEVKKVGEEEQSGDSTVTLAKENGKVSLVVSTGSETRELNVSGFKENLIEVEERPEVEKISIGIDDNGFSLEQRGVTAYTHFPIHVDASRAALSVTTSKGDVFLSVLPYEAVESALRSRLLTRVSKDSLEITDFEGELRYKVGGEKIFDFFGVYQYSIPITAYVSPATGEIVSIDSPTWFRFVKFLFV